MGKGKDEKRCSTSQAGGSFVAAADFGVGNNMKLYRLVGVVLGSLLFLPISCSVGAICGVPIVSWLDSRNVEEGDTVHSLFSAVAEVKNNRERIIVLGLSQIEEVKKSREPVSFLMSKPNGSFIMDQSEWSYKVLENSGDQQLIEVVQKYLDGDNTIWSRYRAKEHNIFPLKSRMFYFGYLFNAIFIGFGFSIVIYILGKILKRHSEKMPDQKNAS